MDTAKILIVDDRPENLLVLESLIDEPGIELVKATSGDEALTKTLDHDFALVLLDVQMPDMDGYEVAELMRGSRHTKNIPIIFVTAGQKDQAHIFKGYDSGAVDFLYKPLEPIILKGKIAVFLELYHQRKSLKDKTMELDKRLFELEELQQQLEETNEQLVLLSTTDGLTKILNRRRFDEILYEEWKRSMRIKKPLAILMADIDHFKTFNDYFGHPRGDEILKLVAQVLDSTVHRQGDRVARYGGEEFIAILPDTDLKGAEEVAANMVNAVFQQKVAHPMGVQDKRLTISVGATSVIPDTSMDPLDIINAADIKLYAAKNEGRNCWKSCLYK